MDPYRGVPDRAETEAPRDRGIVGDVIDQFADPLAFYRELVQNAIDAGTAQIDVTLVRDGDAIRATVRDHGEGMTRDILENQLLVLFRSTKEHDDTKIGKFGIGFASVLAPKPSVVVVTTVREGQRLTLHLNPDLSYQVFDGGPAQRNGTSVELEIPIAEGDVAGFARRSLDALVRWCRHASVPITFTAPGLGAVRVDRPLALDEAIVSVSGVSEDGKTTGVVGVLAGARAYAGFFDHGLTLHETEDGVLGKLAFKVQDARLGHTISRDNVLRDAAYDRAVAFVRELAARALPRSVADVVRASADGDDRRHYRALVQTLDEAGALPKSDAWAVPLIEPRGEWRSIVAADLDRRAWGAAARSPLTAAVAAKGEAVIDVCATESDAHWLTALLERRAGKYVARVDAELTLVTTLALSRTDQTMLEALRRILDDAHRAPYGIALAELVGAASAEPLICCHGDGELVDLEGARASPFERLRRPPLALNARSPQIVAARKRAAEDPVTAASLLARAILLRFGLLDDARSERILHHTLALAEQVLR